MFIEYLFIFFFFLDFDSHLHKHKFQNWNASEVFFVKLPHGHFYKNIL